MGLEVTVVLPGAAPLATVLDNEGAAVLAAIHRGQGVHLVTNDQVIGFEGGTQMERAFQFISTCTGESMIEIHQETDIHGSADKIFAVIVDLRGYERWLSQSTAYAGTTRISADPITAGTTYVESTHQGVRHGTITEFEPPTRVTFHQPMTVKPSPLGIIDISVSYTLTPTAASVHVSRVVTLMIHWPLKAIQPLVVRQFRRESERTLLALKTFAETLR